MNAVARFLKLSGFLARGSSVLWIYAAMIVFYGLIFGRSGHFELNGSAPLDDDPMSCFFVFLLATFLFGGRLAWGTKTQVLAVDSEFILTRAVSRDDVYRARVAIYWMMIMAPIAVIFLVAMWSPSARFHCTQETLDQFSQYLPGAQIQRGVEDDLWLEVPYGAVLVAGWKAAILLLAAVLAQLFAFVSLLWSRGGWVTLAAFVVLAIAKGFFVHAAAFWFAINHGVALELLFILLAWATYWSCRAIYRRLEF